MGKKLVCGVGDADIKASVNGKILKSYTAWSAILNRCYSKKQQKSQPTYSNCTVHKDWLLYSNFKRFYDTNYKAKQQVDKDILIRDNKEYSEQACRFVPGYINKLVIDGKARRGNYKIGVDFYIGKFRSQC